MKYIGNYAHWLDPQWRATVLTTVGQAMPRNKHILTKEQFGDAANSVQHDQYEMYKAAGYAMDAVNWWIYEKEDIDLGELTVPWSSGNEIHYWFSKILPGQFMPMHRDPHVYERTCRRYWIATQDYEPGHIFVYKDEMVKDYKTGDVYEFENENDLHGCANISFSPRVIMQITEYVS